MKMQGKKELFDNYSLNGEQDKEKNTGVKNCSVFDDFLPENTVSGNIQHRHVRKGECSLVPQDLHNFEHFSSNTIKDLSHESLQESRRDTKSLSSTNYQNVKDLKRNIQSLVKDGLKTNEKEGCSKSCFRDCKRNIPIRKNKNIKYHRNMTRTINKFVKGDSMKHYGTNKVDESSRSNEINNHYHKNQCKNQSHEIFLDEDKCVKNMNMEVVSEPSADNFNKHMEEPLIVRKITHEKLPQFASSWSAGSDIPKCAGKISEFDVSSQSLGILDECSSFADSLFDSSSDSTEGINLNVVQQLTEKNKEEDLFADLFEPLPEIFPQRTIRVVVQEEKIQELGSTIFDM